MSRARPGAGAGTAERDSGETRRGRPSAGPSARRSAGLGTRRRTAPNRFAIASCTRPLRCRITSAASDAASGLSRRLLSGAAKSCDPSVPLPRARRRVSAVPSRWPDTGPSGSRESRRPGAGIRAPARCRPRRRRCARCCRPTSRVSRPVRAHRALPHPEGAEVHVERPLVVARRAIDVARRWSGCPQDSGGRAEEPLANRQRAAV